MHPIVHASQPLESGAKQKRQSFRCSVGGPRRRGRLRIGKRYVPVRILDESTGGFGIELEEEPGCQIGDTVLLQIALEWVEVEVVRIVRQASEPDDPEGQLDPAPTRIGLKRLREVDEYEACPDARLWLLWYWFRSGLEPFAPFGRSCKRTGTMILAVVAAGIVIIWVIENSLWVADALKARARKGDYRRVEVSLPFVDSLSSGNSSRSGNSAEGGTASRPSGPPAAQRLHPEFLLRSDVDRLLSLRPQQREQLRRLLEEHREGDAARLGNEASQILTPEQRQRLAELHAALGSSR